MPGSNSGNQPLGVLGMGRSGRVVEANAGCRQAGVSLLRKSANSPAIYRDYLGPSLATFLLLIIIGNVVVTVL
jgi:hypothetical protein